MPIAESFGENRICFPNQLCCFRKTGCLIKNSMISRHNYRKFSKKYGFSEFLMRTEPWGELI